MEIQMEMTLRGIPFAITSGLRFFEQAHIKDVSAFLRFVTNRRDEVAFKRLVQLLPGIGPGSADKMWGAWYKSGWAEKEELPERFSDVFDAIKVPKKSAADWQQIGFILDEMTPIEGFSRPSDMIYSVLEGMYDDYMKSSFDNYEHRKNDVEKLLEYGTTFDDVLLFLEQLSLMSNTDGDPAAKKKEADAGQQVTMSSIHQAKGLEWKVVFLIWLAEGQFPNARVLEAGDNGMLEEERRLFYVAITRAKDQLYMLYPMINPKSYTGDIMQQPSRFLNDFPIDMIEEWNVGSSWTDEEAPF
jgi:DNA helicase-2/ATP-dependent DNA helicase PcrA